MTTLNIWIGMCINDNDETISTKMFKFQSIEHMKICWRRRLLFGKIKSRSVNGNTNCAFRYWPCLRYIVLQWIWPVSANQTWRRKLTSTGRWQVFRTWRHTTHGCLWMDDLDSVSARVDLCVRATYSSGQPLKIWIQWDLTLSSSNVAPGTVGLSDDRTKTYKYRAYRWRLLDLSCRRCSGAL